MCQGPNRSRSVEDNIIEENRFWCSAGHWRLGLLCGQRVGGGCVQQRHLLACARDLQLSARGRRDGPSR